MITIIMNIVPFQQKLSKQNARRVNKEKEANNNNNNNDN